MCGLKVVEATPLNISKIIREHAQKECCEAARKDEREKLICSTCKYRKCGTVKL